MNWLDCVGLVIMVSVGAYILCLGYGWLPRGRGQPSDKMKAIGVLLIGFYAIQLLGGR